MSNLSNPYHRRTLSEDVEVLGTARYAALAPYCRAAEDGTLTEQQFQEISYWAPAHRYFFCSQVSWAVYTTEYMQQLEIVARDLTGRDKPRVLEVCAGRGVLARNMAARQNVEWTATDEHPAEGRVERMDAIGALDRHEDHDLLFVSWVNYESTLDHELANRWVQGLGKPMIIVGEGDGGCTGSSRFWEDPLLHRTPFHMRDLQDVPCWQGMHDFSTIVQPVWKL